MTTDDRKTSGASPSGVGPGPESDPLFGPPTLLEGEDAAGYWMLRRRIRNDVAPQDVIKEMSVRAIVDVLCERLRLRRLKAKFLAAAVGEGLASVLGSLGLSRAVAQAWARKAPEAVAEPTG